MTDYTFEFSYIANIVIELRAMNDWLQKISTTLENLLGESELSNDLKIPATNENGEVV